MLGLFGGGLGLLYVQRPLFAIAYFVASLGGALALVGAALILNMGVLPDVASWVGWVVGIVCAVHAYGIANATKSVAERKWYSRWYGLAAFPVVTLTLILLIRAFVFEPFRSRSESMYPTIPEGSYLFVSKSGFGGYHAFGITLWRGEQTATIERGDLIAHRLVADPATTYLGRIIGLPGERIEYTNRRLIINGIPVPTRLDARVDGYQYAVERLNDTDVTVALMPERTARDWAGVVPPDHYLVFGDSRDNARDSRYIGFIPRDHIVGRVVKIIRPRGP